MILYIDITIDIIVHDTIYRHNQTLVDKTMNNSYKFMLKISHPFYKLSIHFINYASILAIYASIYPNYLSICKHVSIHCYSDEDTDIKAIVKAWFKRHSTSSSNLLEGWIEDYFYQALDWVLKKNENIVETTLVGLIMNGLSHLVGVQSKGEFSCSLVRGLGGNLSSETRSVFAKEV